jgi:GTP cyclohydrolase IIa
VGGDNIIVILPDYGYESLIEEIASNRNLKVGVGISYKPRNAMRLATRALDMIRSGKTKGNTNILTG